jgi:hypothetical protein
VRRIINTGGEKLSRARRNVEFASMEDLVEGELTHF